MFLPIDWTRSLLWTVGFPNRTKKRRTSPRRNKRNIPFLVRKSPQGESTILLGPHKRLPFICEKKKIDSEFRGTKEAWNVGALLRWGDIEKLNLLANGGHFSSKLESRVEPKFEVKRNSQRSHEKVTSTLMMSSNKHKWSYWHCWTQWPIRWAVCQTVWPSHNH